MKKHLASIAVPTAIAICLAVTGCSSTGRNTPTPTNPPTVGHTNNNTTGTPTAKSWDHPQALTGTGVTGYKGNVWYYDYTGYTGKPGYAGYAGYAPGYYNGGTNTSGNTGYDKNYTNVVRVDVSGIKGRLQLKNTLLPTEFPLQYGDQLVASITDNTPTSFGVTFYGSRKNPDGTATNYGTNEVVSTVTARNYNDPSKTAALFPSVNLNNIPQDMAVDLGYGIKGMVEGAAGTKYVSWAEGRWILQLQSKSQNNADLVSVAKKMVAYLDTNNLPAPKQRGFIKTEYRPDGGVNVSIAWEASNAVYELTTNKGPIDALAMAVSVK